MDASGRSSSSARGGTLAAAVALALPLWAGCVDDLPPLTGTTSLRIELLEPADPGSASERLPADDRSVRLSIMALDPNGETDATFSKSVDVYVHYLGGLTPDLEGPEPLTRVRVDDGIANGATIELPPVFGETFLWLEDASSDTPTYATGTSPSLWYRDPYISDISRPEDESRLSALYQSPLELKQIIVTQSRYGARGRLVVTGVYAQGYTISDVECADAAGSPPCTTGDYDHVFVYSFNRAYDEISGSIVTQGAMVSKLTGAIGEFLGLTEVNFPQTFLAPGAASAARIPAPIELQTSWLGTKIEMERVEAALVEVTGEVCPLDDDYTTFSQWKVKLGGTCAINVVSKGQVADFDPADHIGETVRVVGTLRPLNLGDSDIWIVYPRASSDLTPAN